MSNASLFRRMSRADESMIRYSMPRTSEADPVPLYHRVTIGNSRCSTRLVRPVPVLTFTLAEVLSWE